MDEQPLHRKDPQPPRKKKTCTGFLCYKICVILYGFLFLLIGLFMLAIGIWVESVKRDYDSIDDALTSPSTLSIIIGIVVIAFALVGIFGALKENVICLKIFFAVIIIVFIIQVIIGIIAYVYRESVASAASRELGFAMEQYSKHDRITAAIDKVQSRFTCCGLDGPKDWDNNDRYSCSNQDSPMFCSVPESCCFVLEEGKNCGLGVRKNATSSTQLSTRGIRTKGCIKDFMAAIEEHLDAVGAAALALAIPQILGMWLVYVFVIKVIDRRYLFKYRKRLGIEN